MDRLSDLPDSLLHQILWFLPMTDAINTSMLSKSWKKLWTTTPYLNLSDCKIADYHRDFVNLALISWRGTGVQKFKIDFHYRRDDLRLDFEVWLRFAMDKEVEEFYIHVKYVDDILSELYDDIDDEAYWLTGPLLWYSKLKVLSLIGCNLDSRLPMHWDNLESLTIECYGVKEDVIDHVLSRSPRLEVFILRVREIGQKLSIRSSSLKRLSIDKYYCYAEDGAMTEDAELRIWSPNLERLQVSGVPYTKFLLMNVPSLTHAALAFKGGDDLLYGNHFLRETPGQIFPTIQYVGLSTWCIKALGDMKRKELLSPFPNVKYLHLHVCFNECNKKIVDLLEISPKLERLVLKDETGVNSRYVQESPIFCAESNLKFEANLPKSFLLQLRTIDITWFGGDHMIFPLIEILLNYSNKLEMMTFRVRPSFLLALASMRLLRMPKSSRTAGINFRRY